MEAMRQFQLEQAIESEKRQAAEAQFVQKRDKFYELEKKVDEHISDAVRHAEAAIQTAQDEMNHVKSLINAQKELLGQLAVEKESIDPTDLQKIAESDAKAQKVKEEILNLKSRRKDYKKIWRLHTDERERLKHFKGIRIAKKMGTL